MFNQENEMRRETWWWWWCKMTRDCLYKGESWLWRNRQQNSRQRIDQSRDQGEDGNTNDGESKQVEKGKDETRVKQSKWGRGQMRDQTNKRPSRWGSWSTINQAIKQNRKQADDWVIWCWTSRLGREKTTSNISPNMLQINEVNL